MLRRRHRGIPLRDLKKRYFKSQGGNNWVFTCMDSKGNPMTLYQMGWTSIKRHTLCADLNPFDLNNREHFKKMTAKAARQTTGLSKRSLRLLNKQQGICPVCLLPLLGEETLEVHHVKAQKDGGDSKFKNLRLLHRLCHVQITHSKDVRLRAV